MSEILLKKYKFLNKNKTIDMDINAVLSHYDSKITDKKNRPGHALKSILLQSLKVFYLIQVVTCRRRNSIRDIKKYKPLPRNY